MYPAPFRVVLDANVLFPFTVRDTLLRCAAAGMLQVHWSEEILSEASRNLIGKGRMSQEQAAYLMAAMRNAFPEALVRGHEPLIESMPNQEKDRHVAAAAVKIGAGHRHQQPEGLPNSPGGCRSAESGRLPPRPPRSVEARRARLVGASGGRAPATACGVGPPTRWVGEDSPSIRAGHSCLARCTLTTANRSVRVLASVRERP